MTDGRAIHQVSIVRDSASGPGESDRTIDALNKFVLIIADLMISAVMMSAVRVGRWADIGEVRDAYDVWHQVACTNNAVLLMAAHYRTHQAGAAMDGIIEMRRGVGLNRHERRISLVRGDWPDIQDLIVALDPDSSILTPTET